MVLVEELVFAKLGQLVLTFSKQQVMVEQQVKQLILLWVLQSLLALESQQLV